MTTPIKKDETKAVAVVKPEEKAMKPVEAKPAAKKAPVKKAEAKAEKKPAAKKAAAKAEVLTSVFVEYQGRQVKEEDLVASVKKAWTAAGHKAADLKSMELYVKPEDAAVYYVVNGTETGKVGF